MLPLAGGHGVNLLALLLDLLSCLDIQGVCMHLHHPLVGNHFILDCELFVLGLVFVLDLAELVIESELYTDQC